MKRTPLYQKHVELGARLVDFAGYEMPLHYQDGINHEHLTVRAGAGLFDVSHMAEIRVIGPEATDFLSYATLNEPGRLKVGRGQYNMLPNDTGGLLDDLYVYREGEDEYLVVANASNREVVFEHLKALAQDRDCHVVDESDSFALIALQGPSSPILLGRLLPEDVTELKRNSTMDTELTGVPVKVSRTGYTGEDGFEIFCRPADAEVVWDVLMKAGAVPCGLGARDTLRLEAGFPLYGHELTESSNPLCTPFAWVVKDKSFHGRERMWGSSCARRLVGLRMTERGIPRQGYKVTDHSGTTVGEVTSGTLSPLTRDCIAFAWVDPELSEEGSELAVEVRGRPIAAVVVKPPFYQA
jgi:aminomethyltransferase